MLTKRFLSAKIKRGHFGLKSTEKSNIVLKQPKGRPFVLLSKFANMKQTLV